MNDNLNYSSEVRKGLISMLMFRLYAEERTIYREYVQNALDSINAAVKLHILDQLKDGVVNIDIDYEGRRIVIRDNGKGIAASDAVRILLDISASNKDGITEAGQFGIGRLVGGGYCHNMIFTTSARGEDVATQVVFDVDKIWKMVKQDKEDYLATYVLNEGTTKRQIPAKPEEHFFEVQLNNVREEYIHTLLNKEEILNYLNEVAPVDYKSQFVNMFISGKKSNPQYEKLHLGLEKIQLFVCGTPVRKQYGLNVTGTKDKIESLEYFTIEDSKFGKLAWGWFALTKYTIQIPKDDKLSGIRLRAHNIQIGNANLLSGKPLWSEDRGNSYFYGEIFITHPEISPNTARDGLAPTPEAKAFFAKLEIYFRELRNIYTKANVAKKAIDKINEGVELSKTKGLDYPKVRDNIDNKGVAIFEKLLKNTEFAPACRMLALYQPEYDKALASVKEIKNKITVQDTPKSGVQITGVSEPHQEPSPRPTPITNEQPSPVAEKEQKVSPDKPVEEPTPSDTAPTNPVQPTHTTPPISIFPTLPTEPKGDIVATLNGILAKEEIWIVRKIFKVLNDNCPKNEHDLRLIDQLKMLIVKEFRNGR